MTQSPEVRIGKYPVHDRIGRGGMGDVWLGTHPDLDVKVAVKVMLPQLMEAVPDAESRFFREVRTAARVNHPNVVRVYDAGSADGVCFMVMEFVGGGNTLELLKECGVVPYERVLGIAIDMAKALGAAASHHIVHRDIKPENIMLDEHGTAKLADLGLAKELVDQSVHNLTATGMVFGTPCYMAPEQARDTKNVTIAADIYALGCTLFQLATGEMPYPGTAPLEVITRHATADIPRATSVNPEVPDAFSDILVRMMQKAPEDRYVDPDELLADLVSLRPRRGAVGGTSDIFGSGVNAQAAAPQSPTLRDVGGNAAPTAPAASGVGNATEHIKRGLPFAVAAAFVALLVVVVALGAALLVLSQKSNTTNPPTTIVQGDPDANTQLPEAAPAAPVTPVSTPAPTPVRSQPGIPMDDPDPVPVVVVPEPDASPTPTSMDPGPQAVNIPMPVAESPGNDLGTITTDPSPAAVTQTRIAGTLLRSAGGSRPQWSADRTLDLTTVPGEGEGIHAIKGTIDGKAPIAGDRVPRSYILVQGRTTLDFMLPPGSGKLRVTLECIEGELAFQMRVGDEKSGKRLRANQNQGGVFDFSDAANTTGQGGMVHLFLETAGDGIGMWIDPIILMDGDMQPPTAGGGQQQLPGGQPPTGGDGDRPRPRPGPGGLPPRRR